MKKLLLKNILAIALSVIACLALSNTALADTPPQSGGFGFGAPATCNGGPGLDFGLGCVSTTPAGIANAIAHLVEGIAAGIAIILIIIAGFKIGFSHGDPEALEDGRNMLTAAVIGLVFMLLATVILGILGVDVLGIKFFSFNGSGGVNISN